MRALAALAALLPLAAHAGYACRDLADPEGRRYFQEAPCPPGYRHDPIPDAPLIREEPKIPPGWEWGGAGSEWQFVGYDERGRRVGVWVERGTARPFVSSDVVRLTGVRGGRGRRR